MNNNKKEQALINIENPKWHEGYFSLLPIELRNDYDIALASITKNPNCFYHMSQEFKNDKRIALVAVKNSGLILNALSNELKDDYDVVLASVSNHGDSLLYASKTLKDNKQIALTAVQQDGFALGHVSDELRKDYDVMLTAVLNNSELLKYVSDEIKDDKDIIKTALKYDKNLFIFASERLKNDKELLELYFDNHGGLTDNYKFYKECKAKYNIYKEQEWLDNNIPNNNVKPKVKKF